MNTYSISRETVGRIERRKDSDWLPTQYRSIRYRFEVSLLNLQIFNRGVFRRPANLVLHNTVERIYVGRKFGDIHRGIFLVRGENVVLLGEIVSENTTYLFLSVSHYVI